MFFGEDQDVYLMLDKHFAKHPDWPFNRHFVSAKQDNVATNGMREVLKNLLDLIVEHTPSETLSRAKRESCAVEKSERGGCVLF